MSDEKLRAKLPVWRPWKRELAEEALAQRERVRDDEQKAGMGRSDPQDSKHRRDQIARKKSWRKELSEQVQLPPKERPKNWPAVAAIALVVAAAIALTLLLRFLGII